MGERFGFTFPLSLPLPDASKVTSTLYCGEAFQFLDVWKTGQNRFFCQVTPTEHEAVSSDHAAQREQEQQQGVQCTAQLGLSHPAGKHLWHSAHTGSSVRGLCDQAETEPEASLVRAPRYCWAEPGAPLPASCLGLGIKPPLHGQPHGLAPAAGSQGSEGPGAQVYKPISWLAANPRPSCGAGTRAGARLLLGGLDGLGCRGILRNGEHLCNKTANGSCRRICHFPWK